MITLHMGWRHVLFANWPVPPAIVAPSIPDRMTLDTHEGTAWLSVVPYTNVDVRPTFLPAGWGVRLPELNLRTYVRVREKPGVYFFSLDADGMLGVVGARLLHHLPYYRARTSLQEVDDRIHFESRRAHPGARPVAFDATYEPTADPISTEEGSVARFLVERYRYFTEGKDGTVRHAEISHDPWRLTGVDVDIETNTLFSANGFDEPTGPPIHFYSAGVDTIASRNRRFPAHDHESR